MPVPFSTCHKKLSLFLVPSKHVTKFSFLQRWPYKIETSPMLHFCNSATASDFPDQKILNRSHSLGVRWCSKVLFWSRPALTHIIFMISQVRSSLGSLYWRVSKCFYEAVVDSFVAIVKTLFHAVEAFPRLWRKYLRKIVKTFLHSNLFHDARNLKKEPGHYLSAAQR